MGPVCRVGLFVRRGHIRSTVLVDTCTVFRWPQFLGARGAIQLLIFDLRCVWYLILGAVSSR